MADASIGRTLFGSSTAAQDTGGGLFAAGGSASASDASSGRGLFGSSTAVQSTGGGLFGGSSVPTSTSEASSSRAPFGCSTTAQGTGGGLFGGPSAASTSGGLFGGQFVRASAGGGLFGDQGSRPSSGSPFFGHATKGSVFDGSSGGPPTSHNPLQPLPFSQLFGGSTSPSAGASASVEVVSFQETDDAIYIYTKHVIPKRAQSDADRTKRPRLSESNPDTTISLTRHVYTAHGGAPPHRGDHLTATDTVRLASNLTFREQLRTIAPDGGMLAPMGDPRLCVYERPKGSAAETSAPRKWENMAGEYLDLDKKVCDYFSPTTNKDLVVLLPMRGMD
eukprot:TRINITY_DN74250_c0_g1_i1.p1 TRINITY_DN74250_c0_g1~~TRINITY_DN74250_c0_g1_i1.p1  ORF type:complete len:347 (+),score=44.64 TRINITY_DN74250_c0_g1_i1:38-1042(+)